MSSKKQWLRIASGEHQGLYQIAPFTGQFTTNELPACPCCQGDMVALFDVCQWGFFDDKYRTYAVCKPCMKAFTIDYAIPTYALVPKSAQKRYGVWLSSSKKSAEGGKAPGGI